MHAYSIKPNLHVSFQVESLNFLLGLQHLIGGVTDSMWEQLRQALSENPKLPPGGISGFLRVRALIL